MRATVPPATCRSAASSGARFSRTTLSRVRTVTSGRTAGRAVAAHRVAAEPQERGTSVAARRGAHAGQRRYGGGRSLGGPESRGTPGEGEAGESTGLEWESGPFRGNLCCQGKRGWRRPSGYPGQVRNLRGTRWKVLSKGSSCDWLPLLGASRGYDPIPFSSPVPQTCGVSWKAQNVPLGSKCNCLGASPAFPGGPGLGNQARLPMVSKFHWTPWAS